MKKESKSASELEAMILQQAALRAGCEEVMAVAVREGQIGWRVVAVLRDGRMMTVKAVDDIANELRAQYNLSPEK